MTIVSKDEEQWWTARNSLGQTGSVPVPYIVKVRGILYSLDTIAHIQPQIRNKSTPATYVLSYFCSTMKIMLMVQLEAEHHHARPTQHLGNNCGLQEVLMLLIKLRELIIMSNNKIKPQTYRLALQVATNCIEWIYIYIRRPAQCHIDGLYFTFIFSENFLLTRG